MLVSTTSSHVAGAVSVVIVPQFRHSRPYEHIPCTVPTSFNIGTWYIGLMGVWCIIVRFHGSRWKFPRKFPPLPRKLPSLPCKRADASMEVLEAFMDVAEASIESVEASAEVVQAPVTSIASTASREISTSIEAGSLRGSFSGNFCERAQWKLPWKLPKNRIYFHWLPKTSVG